MSTLGIGIVTYNRLDYLRNCVERIRAHTTSPHRLVVADDGSTDGTREWCAEQGIMVVGTGNRGVCWNKNRALFALQELGCDCMLLVEDDCWPVARGWDLHWRVATALFGHVSYAHPKLDRWVISGTGSATDPFVNFKSTAQVASVSARLLREVGFFDTRFRGYGVGHAEWTTRIKRAGAGFKWATLEDGRRARANLYIRGGVEDHDAPTFKDRANVARNEALFDEIKEEPVYRHPWTTDEEREAFTAEFTALGMKPVRYQRATNPDTPPAERLSHAKPLRKALGRVLEDQRCFALAGGWLDGLVAGLPVHDGQIVPRLSIAAINLLAERSKPTWSVFACGTGPGLAWWAQRVQRTVGVTTDAALLRSLPAIRPEGGFELTQATPAGLAGALNRATGMFDVVTIEPPTRPACLPAAIAKLAPTGILVCHGAARTTVDEQAQNLLAEGGFRELRLTAPVPGDVRVETTSIFYRADNCLGL